MKTMPPMDDVILPVCVLLAFLGQSLAVEETSNQWRHSGRAELRHAIYSSRHHNTNLARNVILFIGDGMGISTVTAARIHAGQVRGESGEENSLFLEHFPHLGLIKTYSVDQQVPDSAASGSAMLTGVKINSGVIGLHSDVTRENCSAFGQAAKLKTLLHHFVEEGLSTGIVTNSRITHATPASAYAHTPSRRWEGDTRMRSARQMKACDQVEDIAKQLIMRNRDIKVLLGGGRRYFLDNGTVDPETNETHPYQRRDGLNLVNEWIKDKANRNLTYSYVWNKQDFDKINPSETDHVLGLFSQSHMDYEGWPYADSANTTQPNLVEMTRKAIRVLQKDHKGYFLLVEGARIDWGHHANSAHRAIRETIELDEAVKTAVRMTSSQDTLIIVTADHSHAFAIQGYAPRGNDILGLAKQRATDGLPHTTLAYTNGPQHGRQDLTDVDTTSPNYRQAGCIPMRAETHAGEDVAAYAYGPMAHLLHGTHEQHYLYHMMEYASCVGWSKQYCQYNQRTQEEEYLDF